MSDAGIRRVREPDVAAVVGLVHELAEYERAPLECQLTRGQLRRALFGPEPALFGHVAEVDGAVVGCALWFLSYSTWQGSHGIYLEDLYVQPAHRGRGLGRGLLAALAEESCRRGFARLEWSVLDWNMTAIKFYESLGARPMDGWTTFRLSGAALKALAQ
ncbi:MAG TPA: GNAT family N-acetyltransferase [Jatrophihabitans sp.]|uniref:GNAT family N-acetyltransferase n=1 Tax=Jatrophihabitans sp. TaxID=1932789 RepID=UPI002F1B10C6